MPIRSLVLPTMRSEFSFFVKLGVRSESVKGSVEFCPTADMAALAPRRTKGGLVEVAGLAVSGNPKVGYTNDPVLRGAPLEQREGRGNKFCATLFCATTPIALVRK